MARFLAIDWDHQQLHIVSATIGRGGVVVQRAAVWQEAQDPSLANAEALGRLLRERLRAAGIAPAPVLACIGRDRLILKEVLHPAVPESDKPAVVRFQAAKELTDAPEDVVIDYTSAVEPAPSGECRALAVIARRELLTTYQTLCKAAGLKLLALAPRPFAALACLQQVIGTTGLTPPPEPPDATVAVLTVTDRWAEFSVGRGEQLLLARSLTIGNTLAGEVRRNVSVFSGQASDRPIRAVYVSGSAEHAALCERLEQMLEIRVYLMDPFAGVDRPEFPQAHRGGFAGVVGLVHAWARGLPINFVHPKEPRPPGDPNKRRLLLGAGVAAALLVFVFSYCYGKLAALDIELDGLIAQKGDLDRKLTQLEDDAKRIKFIDEWAQTEVVWVDELYDLTDMFPDATAMKLTQLTGDPLTTTGKDKHVARMSLTGITTENDEALNSLRAKLIEEGNYRVDSKKYVYNRGGLERQRFRMLFGTNVDIERRPPDKYTRKLTPPSQDNGGRGRGQVPGPALDAFDGGMQ